MDPRLSGTGLLLAGGAASNRARRRGTDPWPRVCGRLLTGGAASNSPAARPLADGVAMRGEGKVGESVGALPGRD